MQNRPQTATPTSVSKRPDPRIRPKSSRSIEHRPSGTTIIRFSLSENCHGDGPVLAKKWTKTVNGVQSCYLDNIETDNTAAKPKSRPTTPAIPAYKQSRSRSASWAGLVRPQTAKADQKTKANQANRPLTAPSKSPSQRPVFRPSTARPSRSSKRSLDRQVSKSVDFKTSPETSVNVPERPQTAMRRNSKYDGAHKRPSTASVTFSTASDLTLNLPSNLASAESLETEGEVLPPSSGRRFKQNIKNKKDAKEALRLVFIQKMYFRRFPTRYLCNWFESPNKKSLSCARIFHTKPHCC